LPLRVPPRCEPGLPLALPLRWPALLQKSPKPPSLHCTNRRTKPSLPCPLTPTVADYRTRNRLILRVPASERPPVTAEAAGSGPVAPAILFEHLQRTGNFRHGPLWSI